MNTGEIELCTQGGGPMYRYLRCMTFFLSPAALAQAPYPQRQTYRIVGPVVDVPTQAVSLSIAVIGTPFRLHYRNGGGDRMWSWSVQLMTPRERCCPSATVGRDRQADYFVSGRATRTGPAHHAIGGQHMASRGECSS